MTDRKDSVLRQMMMKGKEYREEFELEYFGETTTLFLKPIPDEEFYEMIEDIDEDIDKENVEDKLEQLEEGEEEQLAEDAEFDTDFIKTLKEAAKIGIDPEPFEEDQEFIDEFVDSLVGGVSVEIGSEVMEMTSNLQEAENFRRK